MDNLHGVIIIVIILLMLISLGVMSHSINGNDRSTVRIVRFPDDTYMKYHIMDDTYFIVEVSGNKHTILNYLDEITSEGKIIEFHPYIKDRFIKR